MKDRLKSGMRTKREELGINGLEFSRITHPEVTSIKEGTDEEPMRATDGHILQMLNMVLARYNGTQQSLPGHSSTRKIEHVAGFVAGRYVVLIFPPPCCLNLSSLLSTSKTITYLFKHRWAAKEAIIKAYHSRRLTFHDIAILPSKPVFSNTGSRPPVAVIISESGTWEDGQIVPLSISHDGDYAIATCMAYEPSPGAVFESADDVNKVLGGTKHTGGSRSIELESEAGDVNNALVGGKGYKGSRSIRLESEADDVDKTLGGTRNYGSSRLVDLETERDEPLAEALRASGKGPSRMVPSSSSNPTFRRISLPGRQLEESEEDPPHHRNTTISSPNEKNTRQNDEASKVEVAELTRQNKGEPANASIADSTLAVAASPDGGHMSGRSDIEFEVLLSNTRNDATQRLAQLKAVYSHAQCQIQATMRPLFLMPYPDNEALQFLRHLKPKQHKQHKQDPFNGIAEYLRTMSTKRGPDQFQSLLRIRERISLLEQPSSNLLSSYKHLSHLLSLELSETARYELPDIPAADLEGYIAHERSMREAFRTEVPLAAELWQRKADDLPIRFLYDIPQYCTERDLASPWADSGERIVLEGVSARMYRSFVNGTDLSTGVLIFKSPTALHSWRRKFHRYRDLRLARRHAVIKENTYPRLFSEPQLKLRAAISWIQHQRQLQIFSTDNSTNKESTIWKSETVSESASPETESEPTSPTESLAGGKATEMILMASRTRRRIVDLTSLRGSMGFRARRVTRFLSLMPSPTKKEVPTTTDEKAESWGRGLRSDLDAVSRVASERPGSEDFSQMQNVEQKVNLLGEGLEKLLDGYKRLLKVLQKELVVSARYNLPDIPLAELENFITHEERIRANLPKDVLLAAELWQLNPESMFVLLFYDVSPEYEDDDLSRPWLSQGGRLEIVDTLGKIYRNSDPGKGLSTGAAIFKSHTEFNRWWRSSPSFKRMQCLRPISRAVLFYDPLTVEERAAVTWMSFQRQLKTRNTDDPWNCATKTIAEGDQVSDAADVKPNGESTSATETLSRDEIKDTVEEGSPRSLRTEYDKYLGRLRGFFGSK